MNKKNFCVITFDSTHDAITTKKILEEHLDIEMIPTPKEISATCGLSLRFDPVDYEEIILCLLAETKVESEKKIYWFQYNDGNNNLKSKKWN